MNQVDFGRGNVNPRAPVELQLQVFSFLAVFVQHFQPTESTDSVRQVNDQVTLSKVEKAVDGFAVSPSTPPAQFGAMKDLVSADHNQRICGDTGQSANSESGMNTAGEDLESPGLADRGLIQDFMNPLCFPFDASNQVDFRI